MNEHAVEPALGAARSSLRAEQRRVANVEATGPTQDPVTDRALDRFRVLAQTVPDEATGRVRRGAFTYVPELEAERVARGEALIRRVEPGPLEDPNYFALLAYQAASIELAHRELWPEHDRFAKFLLGTVHAPDVNAFARRTETGDYTLVVLYSGLVDFVYQAAKVTVEAIDWERVTEGPGLVHASLDLESVRAGLKQHSAAADRLYATMEAYFFGGYPRASSHETVPDVQHPPLAMTVALAERWIIGHEYGHGLLPAIEDAPPEVNVGKAEEHVADYSATIATVLSAAKLDAMPPEFPLAAATFALKCLDLLQRGSSILRTGDEAGIGDSTTHPAPEDRAEGVITFFRRFFDFKYRDGGGFDVWLDLESPAGRETPNFTPDDVRRAYAYANVIGAVWAHVRPRLLDDYRRGRQLHVIWR